MLKNLDRALAILLSLGAIGHTFGSIAAFRRHRSNFNAVHGAV
jgi:hypothetical protein